MLGVILSLAAALGFLGIGALALDRLVRGMEDQPLDPAAHFGLSGLLGLGIAGWITFPIGILPQGLRWGIAVIGALALAGLVIGHLRRDQWKFKLPQGTALLAIGAIGLACAISMVGVLAPSDTLDWDSLAYHFAVPKLWLAAGQIQFVSFIHHSNFPFVIDNLYIWGITWGGQSGAKAFSWVFCLLGTISLFGLARMRYGNAAGWWTAVAFQCVPIVIWLSGTGYIDVSNGLYAGLGILFAAWSLGDPKSKTWLGLAAVFLGLAAASKYTGLQTIAAVGVVLGIAGLAQTKQIGSIKQPIVLAVVAVAIACPWYVKNVVNTGNPVYPFFYATLGGKNWDTFSETIYKEEQQTFGAGRPPVTAEQPNYGANPLQPTRLGHAILGLAYQPGRYINPGPTTGSGVVIGALGFVALLSGLLWGFSGRAKVFEKAVLATVGISLLMWFVLSEQSRYIIAMSVPLAVLAGGAVTRLSIGRVFGGAIGLQAAVSLVLAWMVLISPPGPEGLATPLQAALGQVSAEEYQARKIGFYEPAQYLNGKAKDGKVALFDEVFGSLLDVPYFWANPGHTTELGYDQMQTGADLVASLKRLGITHVYLNLSIYPTSDPEIQKWYGQMGLTGSPIPITDEDRQAKFGDARNKWKLLMAEAIAQKLLTPSMAFGRSQNKIVFTISE